MREELEGEEDVGEVVYLRAAFMVAGAGFVLEDANASVQKKIVNNRHFGFDGFSER